MRFTYEKYDTAQKMDFVILEKIYLTTLQRIFVIH